MGLELITFAGLALLVEGVLLALFPGLMKRMMADIALRDPARLRVMGLLAAAAAGAFLIMLGHFAGAGPDGTAALGFSEIRSLLARLG